ncbi:hypothetical protein C3K47_01000 [Solitalea longa]|uniref:Zinc-ribbon 15 domain-containing protein n=1 Tax=Solitalea longa TaxID=2079460 RepID=A0A2S5A9B8_9SPHI|nr:hypothetical protein [Solitalea longa]POY39104.1 hypothetical protein C3K47_01000 [Solitalea longa]
MLLLGRHHTYVGSIPLSEHSCNNCCNPGQMQMSFYASYAHIVQIPLFSIGQKAIAQCKNCQEILEENYFPQDLTEIQHEISSKITVPPLHFIGIGIMVVILLCFALFY